MDWRSAMYSYSVIPFLPADVPYDLPAAALAGAGGTSANPRHSRRFLSAKSSLSRRGDSQGRTKRPAWANLHGFDTVRAGGRASFLNRLAPGIDRRG